MTIIQAKQKFDSSTLCKIFMISNQGGMRRSLKTNSLVLIANHIKGRRSQYTENIDGQNIYEDQWVNDIFYYTGMGLKGDQSLEFAQNKTLNESNQNNVNVYLFEVFTEGEFTFTGKVKLCDNPTSITQEDVNGKQRKVYIFPLKVTDSVSTIEDKSKNFEAYNNTENTFGLSESNLVNLSKDISSFNLSVRAMNVLKNNNMKTLGDITKVSEYYFSKLPNVGHKTLVEINELLSSHLLSFDMNIDDIDTSVEIDEDEIISSLNLDTENFDLTQRTRNIIRLLNLSKIGHIIEFSESRLLAQKNFGKKSHNELKKLLLSHNLSFDTKIGHLKWDSLENTKKLKQVIEKKEKNIRKKISDINFTTLLDDRDHNIMMKRLQGLSLQEVGDEINITRERVRQVERKIYSKIILNLNEKYLSNKILEFVNHFKASRKPLGLYDVVKIVDSFEGIEDFNYPYKFIEKITEGLSKKNLTPVLLNEKIDQTSRIFYPNINGVNSYIDLVNKIKNKHRNTIILEKTNIDKNDDIIYEIYSSKRMDIFDLVTEEIQDVKLNQTERLVSVFKEQEELISTPKALKLAKIDRYTNSSKMLNDHGIYEFGRSKWGILDKFYLLDKDSEKIITDYIIDVMEQNPEKQYRVVEFLKLLEPNLKYILDNSVIDKIDEYQIDILLSRAKNHGIKIYDLGRRTWSLQKDKRKFDKDLIREILYEANEPMTAKEIINKINKTKTKTINDTLQINEDKDIKRYPDRKWGLRIWDIKKNIEVNDTEQSENEKFNKDDKISLIKKFIKLNHHSEVPFDYIENDFNLGEWVKEIRNKERKGTLSLELYRDLNAISGWEWDSYQIHRKNNIYLTIIKSYIEKNGNSDIPTDYNEKNIRIGQWCFKIRVLYDTNLIDRTTKDFLDELKGWNWSVKKTSKKSNTDDVIFALRSYLRTNHISDIKNNSKTIGGIDLYNYRSAQKTRYKQNKLDKKLIDKLESIDGWSW